MRGAGVPFRITRTMSRSPSRTVHAACSWRCRLRCGGPRPERKVAWSAERVHEPDPSDAVSREPLVLEYPVRQNPGNGFQAPLERRRRGDCWFVEEQGKLDATRIRVEPEAPLEAREL